MNKATEQQILAVAKKHKAIGFNGLCLYGVDENGGVKRYAVAVYRDSFYSLAAKGKLRYNGDHTYSAV